MSKIMEPHIVQTGDGSNRAPRLFEVHQCRPSLLPDDYVRIAFEAGQLGHNRKGGGWQV